MTTEQKALVLDFIEDRGAVMVHYSESFHSIPNQMVLHTLIHFRAVAFASPIMSSYSTKMTITELCDTLQCFGVALFEDNNFYVIGTRHSAESKYIPVARKVQPYGLGKIIWSPDLITNAP